MRKKWWVLTFSLIRELQFSLLLGPAEAWFAWEPRSGSQALLLGFSKSSSSPSSGLLGETIALRTKASNSDSSWKSRSGVFTIRNTQEKIHYVWNATKLTETGLSFSPGPLKQQPRPICIYQCCPQWKLWDYWVLQLDHTEDPTQHMYINQTVTTESQEHEKQYSNIRKMPPFPTDDQWRWMQQGQLQVEWAEFWE